MTCSTTLYVWRMSNENVIITSSILQSNVYQKQQLKQALEHTLIDVPVTDMVALDIPHLPT